ncbi:Hypothetical protein NTJ_00677 [Nesidiocoris tenuis]|uniref:Odorant receptor n=1 Tax=Nesidiocoris tenuis TaxID=355587 RepID=A0ABN7AAH0_9HEMI|nr:Hypothetical protein NTJ_00677 [Nesidiocoris tenuis]
MPWEHKDLTKLWRWPIARYLNTFGWWAEDYERPLIRLIFNVIRAVFFSVNVAFLLSLTIGVCQQMASTSNVMDNLFSFFAAGPSFVGFGKIIGLMSQRGMWRKIWSDLDDMLKDVVNRGVDAKMEAEIRWRYKRCWAMYSIFLSVGTCITLHWLVRPIVYAMYGERTSIVDTWPTYLNTWLQWFTTYIFQAMNISSFGHSLYLYDNVYFCTCENILVQFAILKHHLYMMDISRGKPGGVDLQFCIAHHKKLIK